MTEQADAFLTAWTTAEQAGYTRIPEQLPTAGFTDRAPGFILSKAAWLARHQGGDLAYTDFGLDQIQAASGPCGVTRWAADEAAPGAACAPCARTGTSSSTGSRRARPGGC